LSKKWYDICYSVNCCSRFYRRTIKGSSFRCKRITKFKDGGTLKFQWSGTLDQLIEINFDERIQFMKKFSSKLIIFFVALCFSLTLCGSIKAAEGQKININTASKEELIELQKIGPQKAEAIINYRENVGSFQKPEDIMNVSGIGEATYEINKDIIVVNPPISE